MRTLKIIFGVIVFSFCQIAISQIPSDAPHPMQQLNYEILPASYPYPIIWFQGVSLANATVDDYIKIDWVKVYEVNAQGTSTLIQQEDYKRTGTLTINEGGLYNRSPKWFPNDDRVEMNNDALDGEYLIIKPAQQSDKISHWWLPRFSGKVGFSYKVQFSAMVSGNVSLQAGCDFWNAASGGIGDGVNKLEAWVSDWLGNTNTSWITMDCPIAKANIKFKGALDYGLYTDGKFFISKRLVDECGGSSEVQLRADCTLWQDAAMTIAGDYWIYQSGMQFSKDSKVIYCFHLDKNATNGRFEPYTLVENSRLESPGDAPSNGQGGYNFYTFPLAVIAPVAPVIISTTPASRCGEGILTISATASEGTINWYADSVGENILASGSDYTTPVLTKSTTFYVDAKNNNLTSAHRTPVKAIIENCSVTIIGPDSVCKGSENIKYSIPAIDGANSYVWTLPQKATGTSNSNSINVNFDTSAISGSIKVNVNKSNGDVLEGILAVTIVGLPGVSGEISGTNPLCTSNKNALYSVSKITNATSYIWSLPDGFTGQSNSDSILVNVGPKSITGSIKVKGVNVCGNGAESELMGVTVFETPAAPEIILVNGIFQSNYQFTNYWYYDNGIEVDGYNNFCIPTIKGNYYAIAKNAICNSEKSNVVLYDPTYVNQTIIKNGFAVFPNPTSGSVKITCNFNNKTDFIIQVYDNIGILRQTYYVDKFKSDVEINLNHFSSGIYEIRIASAGYVFQTKVLLYK